MIAALLLATCLVAQPAADGQVELKAKVEQLVRQLDDRELAKREDAEKQLVELGAAILPLLPEPNNRMPAEVRQRLARVTSALEKVRSVSTIEATKVTLQGELPFAEAVAAITRQTGNTIAGYEDIEAKVKADTQDVPFWVAMDQLLDQVQLTPQPLGGQPNTLVLEARPPEQAARVGNAFYEGPFRVEALRIYALRDLRLPAMSGMRVGTSLEWEPRLSPISVSHPFASVQALDENGQPIAISSMRGGREATIHPGMTGIDVEIPLQLVDRSVTKIASLKGEFVVLVPGETEEFVFDKLDRDSQKKTKAGVSVILESVRQNNAVFQILIRVRFEQAEGALESHRTWVLSNEAYLLDPQGETIANAGYESTGQRADEVGVAYVFALPEGQKDLKGCKFVYKTPTTIVRQAVRYELKDLQLP